RVDVDVRDPLVDRGLLRVEYAEQRHKLSALLLQGGRDDIELSVDRGELRARIDKLKGQRVESALGRSKLRAGFLEQAEEVVRPMREVMKLGFLLLDQLLELLLSVTVARGGCRPRRQRSKHSRGDHRAQRDATDCLSRCNHPALPFRNNRKQQPS